MSPGLILAAPASGSGKTVLTLAIARALARRGVRVAAAKAGPDYIDPAFHAAASLRPALNLDAWAMAPDALRALAAGADAELLLCEGAMGLFDGVLAEGRADRGSTAELAAILGWPVVLIVDVRGQAASVAALLRGFVAHRPEVRIAGVVCNRVGSPRHAAVLRAALAELPVPLLGLVPRDARLALPERHLGLVQAGEHQALDAFLDGAAALAAERIDLDALLRLARPSAVPAQDAAPPLPPLGQRVAVARDAAFAFAYDWALASWRRAGAEIVPFSPLADEAPDAAADAVYLPGGYPELHAGRLAANRRFKDGLRQAAARGAGVYGECGGYMALGEALIDAEGERHAMAGLLPLVSSFAARRLQLGYRQAATLAPSPLGRAGRGFRGHEFHYATALEEGPGAPLFELADAGGASLGPAGRVAAGGGGIVAGSFVHLIAAA